MLIVALVVTFGVIGAEVDSKPARSPAVDQFEVASVKPTSLPAQHTWRILPGRFTATATPLEMFIARAYGIPSWRILDEPKWVQEEYFDIQATSAESAARDEMLAMLRKLLVERFQLKVQFEPREADVDLLVLERNEMGERDPDCIL